MENSIYIDKMVFYTDANRHIINLWRAYTRIDIALVRYDSLLEIYLECQNPLIGVLLHNTYLHLQSAFTKLEKALRNPLLTDCITSN